MAILSWSASLETGHPGIDEQHKSLIQAFKDLHAAKKQGKGKDEVALGQRSQGSGPAARFPG